MVQSAETRLRDMQTLVQQEAGVVLDRQRITIEGIPMPNPNHAYALLPLACPFLCMVLFHLHLRSIALHVNGYKITLPAPPEYCFRAAVSLIMVCCTCILEHASLMLLMKLWQTCWLVTS